MRPKFELVLPPGGVLPLLAALEAKQEEIRRTLSDPSAAAGDLKRAEAAAQRVAILMQAVRGHGGLTVAWIAYGAKCPKHVVRRAIHDFNERGLDAVYPRRAGRKPDEFGEKQYVLDLKQLVEQMPEAGPKELAAQLGLSVSRYHHYRNLAKISRRRTRGSA